MLTFTFLEQVQMRRADEECAGAFAQKSRKARAPKQHWCSRCKADLGVTRSTVCLDCKKKTEAANRARVRTRYLGTHEKAVRRVCSGCDKDMGPSRLRRCETCRQAARDATTRADRYRLRAEREKLRAEREAGKPPFPPRGEHIPGEYDEE